MRASAASALGSISVDVEGKRQAFEAGAAESLIALLRDKNLPVVLLSVRALASIAEFKRQGHGVTIASNPQEGVYRSVFDKALPQLRMLTSSQDRVLAKSARDCESLISWRP